ncbi:hypothetical protein [Prosthecobacter sp.]|uniref:hypothetical protein n=1 Tax=Prosthecobacter sp. TaxID=1965333 RepID=UPI00378517C3
MSANQLNFCIDVPNRRLIRDFFSNLEILPRALIQGDTVHLRIIAVEPNIGSDPSRPWRYVSLPTSVYFGIGPVGVGPTLGTFTLTFGADTTTALAYNITAAALQTALNALASITSAGGVDVTGPDSGPYQVVFRSNGSRADITGNADLLYPLSTIQTYKARAGDAGTPEIQVIVIDRQPAALAETFTAISSPGITITTLQDGASGVPEVQKISLDPTTHGGTFTVTYATKTTVALPYNISAADLQTALQALSSIGANNCVVTGAFPDYVVTFQGTLTGNLSAMTASAAGLIGPVGVEGDLSLNTAGIEQLLNGAASVDTTLEITAQIDGSPITLLQTTVTLKNDQIPNAPVSGTGLPSYYTASEADALFVPQQTGSIADLTADADTAHNISSTFSDTEVEGKLNALATKLNATTTALNSVLAKLRAAGLIDP